MFVVIMHQSLLKSWNNREISPRNITPVDGLCYKIIDSPNLQEIFSYPPNTHHVMQKKKKRSS